jgi:hypothetical protein
VELEPVEIVEDAQLVLASASLAIVVLDSQQDAAVAPFARGGPDVLSVQHMSEVKPTGGRRGESRQHPVEIAGLLPRPSSW